MPAPAGTRCLECAHTVVAELVWSCSLPHFVAVPVVSFVVEHRPVSRGGVQPQSGDWTLPDEGEGTGWLQDAGRIGMACRHRLGQPPIGVVGQEARLAGGAVRWQAEVE